MRYFLLIVFIFFLQSCAAPESHAETTSTVNDMIQIFSTHSFKGKKDFNLEYIKFGKRKGSKGSLILVTGFNENAMMYMETFEDLYHQGWSPIYSYDHRGMGRSDRALEDNGVGYVEDWSFYIEDLKKFIEIAKKDPLVENLSLISHSTGGNITSALFQKYPEEQKTFNSAVFSSPYFDFHTGVPWFSSIATGTIKTVCVFFSCKRRPLGESSKERPLLVQSNLKNNKVTHSLKRLEWLNKISKEHNAHGIRPSLDWVIKGVNAGKEILKKENLQKIELPILILQAEQDKIVSNKKQNKFCEGVKNCHLKVIGGYHAHFLEVDEYRDKALKETTNFLAEFSGR